MSEPNVIHESNGPIPLTQKGKEKLQAELDFLMLEKRPEIAERIRESQQHGEFSEDNNELDEVKFEQAIVESRIGELRAVFSDYFVIDDESVPTDYVGIGSLVTVSDLEFDDTFSMRIVSSIEADPENYMVSTESPVGRALLDQKKGDDVTFETPSGRKKYKILDIAK